MAPVLVPSLYLLCGNAVLPLLKIKILCVDATWQFGPRNKGNQSQHITTEIFKTQKGKGNSNISQTLDFPI